MSARERRARLVDDRIAAIRDLLADRGARGALLASRPNFAWATAGGEAHVVLSSETAVAAMLITPDSAVVLTAVNEAVRMADEELEGLGLEVVALPWQDEGVLQAEASRRAGGQPLDDAALERDLQPIRCRLSELELERMTWLAGRAGSATAEALAGVSVGRTEHEAAAEVLRTLALEGVRAPVLLAAADDRIARYRHPLPTGRRVERRLMLVVVAERWGLHVAVTRFAELVPPDPELAGRMDAARRVHGAMVAATRVGDTLGDVLAAARRAYEEEGHADEWRLHHQGGIIGYRGRERIAVPDDPTLMERGMAFAWNPSIAGAKAEETIVLDGPEPRVLTA